MNVLFVFVVILLNFVGASAVELKDNFSTHQSGEIETEKLFIVEAVENGRRNIQHLWDDGDGSGRLYYDVLEIPYNITLTDGSEVNLTVTWASNWFAHGAALFINWSRLNTMRDTFYLEVGDQIEFSKPTKGYASRWDETLVYFTIYRDEVEVGTYQGWLSI